MYTPVRVIHLSTFNISEKQIFIASIHGEIGFTRKQKIEVNSDKYREKRRILIQSL